VWVGVGHAPHGRFSGLSISTERRRSSTPVDDTTDDATTRDSGPHVPPDGGPRRGRRFAAGLLTALAGVLVFLALVAPRELEQFTPAAFLRIPVEALAGAVLLLLLPPRARRWVAGIGGAVLGLLTVLKMLDLGFAEVLARPFDPVLDSVLLDDGVTFLAESLGTAGAFGVVVAVAVLVCALLVLMTLAAIRLARVLGRHRAGTARIVAVLGVAWVACAVFGVQLVHPVPVAARSAAALAYHKAMQVPENIRDQEQFAAEVAVDAFHDTPPEQLLTGLRGKDVVLSFVESYGRSAVENPEFAGQVGAVLDDGTRRLADAGFASRSAYLTSPTAGGGSWLAHATLLSGAWIDNERRYDDLHSTDRRTLTSAFWRAGWRTVGVMPGNVKEDWPEAAFYGYDQVHDSRDLEYQGEHPGFTMPDQATLAAFERLEHALPGNGPVMAEIPLVSSHAPWSPIPRLVGWNEVDDGSVLGPSPAPEELLARDTTQLRADYRRAIEYSLSTLISYVETYGDDNLVLVFLGDHQPAPIITGDNATQDVPITIVARDPAVLDQIADWGWQDGLKPGPDAPVWGMDTFRDRFLTAFSSIP
jgi:hypothetical protein